MIKSTKTGQKPPKNRLSSYSSSPNSGGQKKVKKTALKSVLDIMNHVDLQSPKTADKIDKMIRESYGVKIDQLGTTINTLNEELSLSGLPHDLIRQLGLSPTEKEKNRSIPRSVPVYRVKPEVYDKNIGEGEGGKAFISSDPKNDYGFTKGDLGHFVSPVIFLKGYNPSALVHEATHITDLDLDPKLIEFKTEFEYQLSEYELSANFNQIIAAIYNNNNITYPLYFSQNVGNVLDLQTVKRANSSSLILWGLIKESIEKNGFKETINNKKEIIKKTKKYLIEKIMNIFFDAYYLTSKHLGFSKGIKNIYLIFKDMILSSTLSKEDKTEIIKQIIKKMIKPDREWMPEKVEDEIYNFYGDRFLRKKKKIDGKE